MIAEVSPTRRPDLTASHPPPPAAPAASQASAPPALPSPSPSSSPTSSPILPTKDVAGSGVLAPPRDPWPPVRMPASGTAAAAADGGSEPVPTGSGASAPPRPSTLPQPSRSGSVATTSTRDDDVGHHCSSHHRRRARPCGIHGPSAATCAAADTDPGGSHRDRHCNGRSTAASSRGDRASASRGEDAATTTTTAAPLPPKGVTYDAASPPPLGMDASNTAATAGPGGTVTASLGASGSSLSPAAAPFFHGCSSGGRTTTTRTPMTMNPRHTWRPLVARRCRPHRPPCAATLVQPQLWGAAEQGLCVAVLLLSGAVRDMAVGGGSAADHARSW
ncbi:uncharacterized protein [Miscanthus floridulus]|uniref:uncharacterized protein n=1 Tax=Miscanthus floridulus TaxID=154761 RepID=UPI00345A7EEF